MESNIFPLKKIVNTPNLWEEWMIYKGEHIISNLSIQSFLSIIFNFLDVSILN